MNTQRDKLRRQERLAAIAQEKAQTLDEVWGLPTTKAATIALRTQQIIAHESGVTNTVDPLGGSYLIENLTQEIKERANAYIRRIDEMGGMIPAIERGYPQTESSGKTAISAPAAWACRAYSTIFFALPQKSPMVGLICPSAIFTYPV